MNLKKKPRSKRLDLAGCAARTSAALNQRQSGRVNMMLVMILTLPTIAVVASCYTFYLAHKGDLGVVSDKYYKEGLAVNKDFHQNERAKAMAIQAKMMIQGQQVHVQLNAAEAEKAALNASSAQGLLLTLESVSDPKLNQKIQLAPKSGMPLMFVGQLTQPAKPSTWLIKLLGTDWRLEQRVNNGPIDQIELKP